jgi:hypothetical protein
MDASEDLDVATDVATGAGADVTGKVSRPIELSRFVLAAAGGGACPSADTFVPEATEVLRKWSSPAFVDI